MDALQCDMCNFNTNSSKLLAYHLIRKHKNDPTFRVKCCASDCKYTTKSWSGFKSHFSRKHRYIGGITHEAVNDPAGQNGNPAGVEQLGIDTSAESVKMQCAAFALKLMARHKLPATAVDDILETTASFITYAGELTAANAEANIAEKLKELSTSKLRLSYMQRSCGYQHPREVVLGHSYIRKKGMLVKVKNCGYVIPMEKAIEQYLQKPEIWSEIISGHESQSDMMLDFCDGNMVKSDGYIRTHQPCLMFAINTDSIEIVNPIGTHVKKNKLDVFYWTLLNLKPALRSKWCNIQLFALCKTVYLKQYGMDKIMDNFIQTMQQLFNGMFIKVGATNHKVYGKLIVGIADTPAAAFLGNTKQSSSFSHRFCRTCNITSHELNTRLTVSELEERNSQLHLERCQSLQDMPARLKPFWSKQWGLNGFSPLLKLPYINLAECLIHDPMHCLLEGIFPYATAILLQRALQEKVININWLNTQISIFPYSYLDKDNKPEQIFKSHVVENASVKQSAASQLTLCYVLPYILRKKIHLDCFYKNYMHLCSIVQICCSPHVSVDTAGELQELVEGYLQEFKRCYPTLGLRPKHHFLLHLPIQILRYGPLRNQWLMRFESKNNSFKNYKVHNFINLSFSMAKSHQLRSCYDQLRMPGTNPANVHSDGVKEGHKVQFRRIYPALAGDFLRISNNHHDDGVYNTPEVTINGLKYRKDACLLVKTNGNWPDFVQIRDIFVYEELKFAVCVELQTIAFEWTLNAYHVMLTNNICLTRFCELENKWPVPAYPSGNGLYINNRYTHIGQGLF